MAKRGRPSLYSDGLATEICLRLAQGESLRAICEGDGMPAEATVRGWAIDDVSGFTARYARARELQADFYADQTIEISDGATDKDSAAAARVQIQARQWIASKLKPKAYGDKLTQEITGKDGAPIVPVLNVAIGGTKPDPAS